MTGQVRTTCPHCGRESFTGVISDKASIQSGGKIRVNCEHCGKTFVVPADETKIDENNDKSEKH